MIKHRLHTLAAVLIATTQTAALAAQDADGPTGTILGMVYDSTTSAPLAEARVAVMGTSA